ncbi:zf-TFIIB domain-containing protein [bacterium]|nr:zf-TFIIB domain-containing protein [bacterium]
MNAPFESKSMSEDQKNPLVNYLRIFQNQHRIITILYRGLIISFCGFIFLLSFLIVTVFDSNFIPIWGKTTLSVIDFLLLLGIAKAFYELGKYRKKSVEVLNQVYDYLKHDLSKFEKIKSEQQAISQSHKKLQNKILSFSSKSKKQIIHDHQGWDCQICPKCNTALEMLVEVCPQCLHNLGKIYTN